MTTKPRFVPFVVLLLSAVAAAEDPWRLAATTSLIAEAARRIGGGRVEVVALLPPRACPGHFDMDAKTLAWLSSCRVLSSHEWEQWVSGDVPPRRVLSTRGNWMLPAVQSEAVREIAEVLCREDEEGCPDYRANAEGRRTELAEIGVEFKRRIGRFKGVPVLCGWALEEFLKEAGFDVAAVYNGMETLTVRQAAGTIDAGKKRNARLVVDNLQSGDRVGVSIAEELGVPHAVLTNFLLEDGYESSLRDNLTRLEKALHD